MRGGRSLVAVRSLGKQRHSSSEVGGLVVASKRRRPANVGRRLVEAPRQVRLLNIFSVVRAAKLHMRQWRSPQLNWKMPSVVRLVEASRLLMIFSVVKAAKLRMRKWRSSPINGWELLLLLKRGSRLDG